MRDEISDLRVFVRIATAGSLSEAARRSHSSPPAMSRRLAALEARLGVRLVERSSKRFALTEEGLHLQERASRILREVDDLEAETSSSGRQPSGHLRVRAPTQIGRQRLAPLVGAFGRLHPRTSVELVLTDDDKGFHEGEYDVAFTVGLPVEPNLVAKRVSPAKRVVVCASPAYFAEHGRPSQPADLLDRECLLLVRGRRVFNDWLFEVDGEEIHVRVRGRLSTTSSEVVRGWAIEGLGIATKLHWDVADDLANGSLEACLEHHAVDERSIYLARRGSTPVAPRVRAFVDFCSERAEGGGVFGSGPTAGDRP